MIVESIRELLEPDAAACLVEEVRIGLGYTAVVLDSGQAGLAYTPRDDLPADCSACPAAGRLAGRPARESLKRLLGDDPDCLLRAAARCREVVMLGPSTPLVPEAFAFTPVTWLSGVVVTSPPDLLRVVSEGGGTRDFGPYVRRVSVRVPSGQEVAGRRGTA
jgi:uncharacterized protein (DUF4213/DUF364 family)